MFSYDSPFFRFMSRAADVFIAGLLWIIFSVPVVTLGASTSALYHTVHKVIMGNKGYVFKDFWNSYRDHMKDSVICTMIFELLMSFLIYDVTFMKTLLEQNPDHPLGFLYYAFYIMLMIVLVWFVYVFCYRGRFEMGWKGSMINGARFMLASLGWGLLILVGIVVSITIVRDMPFFIFVMPTGNAVLWNYIMEKQYKRVVGEKALKAADEGQTYTEDSEE